MTQISSRIGAALILVGAALVGGCASSSSSTSPSPSVTPPPSVASAASGAGQTSGVPTPAVKATAAKPPAAKPDPNAPKTSSATTASPAILPLPATSAAGRRRAGREAVQLNERCASVPNAGGIGAITAHEAASHAHGVAQVLAEVRGPVAWRRVVMALAGRIDELAGLYLHAGDKPTRRLGRLVKAIEQHDQTAAAALGLAFCGPIAR